MTELYEKDKRKYESRGWKLTDESVMHWNRDRALPRDESRHVGDSKTCTILLDVECVDVPATPDYVLENAHFSLHSQEVKSYTNNPPEVVQHYYDVCAHRLNGCILEHQYTSGKACDDFWTQFMPQHLDSFALAEFLAPGAEETVPLWMRERMRRPFGLYGLGLLNSRGEWKPTKCMDEQIPQLAKEWKEWAPGARIRHEQELQSWVPSDSEYMQQGASDHELDVERILQEASDRADQELGGWHMQQGASDHDLDVERMQQEAADHELAIALQRSALDEDEEYCE